MVTVVVGGHRHAGVAEHRAPTFRAAVGIGIRAVLVLLAGFRPSAGFAALVRTARRGLAAEARFARNGVGTRPSARGAAPPALMSATPRFRRR